MGMNLQNWQRISNIRIAILAAYVAVWIAYYIVAHSASPSQGRHGHGQDPVDVFKSRAPSPAVSNVFVETIKLLAVVVAFVLDRKGGGGVVQLLRFVSSKNVVICVRRYIPVALLYACYNNLMMTNLRAVQPTTYLILSSSRLIMIAFTWQIVFRKKIARSQWQSIFAITVGILLQNIGNLVASGISDHDRLQRTSVRAIVMIMFQMGCSVAASLYNEKMLKRDDYHMHLQNACLYLVSVVINLAVAMVFPPAFGGIESTSDLWRSAQITLSKPHIFAVCTLAAAGIMSSLVLRYETSVTKGVASASESMIIPFIEKFVFGGTTISLSMVVSSFFVGAGVFRWAVPATEFLPKRSCFTIRLKSRLVLAICCCTFLSLCFHIKMTVMMNITDPSTLTNSLQATGVGQLVLAPATLKGNPNNMVSLNDLEQLFGLPTNGNDKLKHTIRRMVWSNRTMENVPLNSRVKNFGDLLAIQEVIRFIVDKLEEKNIPISIFYGTLLLEYRNGTGPFFFPYRHDKDVDLVVFERHFDTILQMDDDLRRMFGWGVTFVEKKDVFLTVRPLHRRRGGKLNQKQVDIYGFRCIDNNKFIHIRRDRVSVRLTSFLPLTEYARPVPGIFSKKISSFRAPLDPACLLPNMYGRDFMTPKKGHFIQHEAYDNPICQIHELSASQTNEFERQIKFCASPDENMKQHSIDSTANIPSSSSPEQSNKKYDDGDRQVGLVACINNREDVAHSIALAQDIDWLWKSGSSATKLELYHDNIVSEYLRAQLESIEGVLVVNYHYNGRLASDSCTANAISMTKLSRAFLVNPSIVMLSSFDFGLQNIDMWQKPEVKSMSSITSTCPKTDTDLRAVDHKLIKKKFKRCHLHAEAVAGRFVMSKVQATEEFSVIGTIHFVTGDSMPSPVSAWIYPDQSQYSWISRQLERPLYHCRDKIVQYAPAHADVMDYEISEQVKRNWKAYLNAYRTLLLDRPIGWVAFDGGLVPRMPNESAQTNGNETDSRKFCPCPSFNSISSATESFNAGESSRTMINIDLAMTGDNVSIGMHEDDAFGPYSFPSNHLPANMRVSLMNWKNASETLGNPCIPKSTIRTWMDGSQYHDYGREQKCTERVSQLGEFISFLEKSKQATIVFDLKATTADGQIRQAEQIKRLISDAPPASNIRDRVAVRFFSVGNWEMEKEAIIPEFARQYTTSSDFHLRYYINAPSKAACRTYASWSRQYDSILAGCFVNEGDPTLQSSWIAFRANHLSGPPAKRDAVQLKNGVNTICDIAKRTSAPDVDSWRSGLLSCVENGYDWVHHPLAISSEASHSLPNTSTFDQEVPLLNSLLVETKNEYTRGGNVTRSKIWSSYKAYWGFSATYSWEKQRMRRMSVGESASSYAAPLREGDEGVSTNNAYRCVSKILTVMLFLRLEELGVMRIHDAIPGIQNKVTWYHVFSNTAGGRFSYDRSLWDRIPDGVRRATGVTFLDAMQEHVLDPIGLKGGFDSSTVYPPYAARGYVGTLEDLLLIGTTLSSGGVSPKTRMQVISQQSVDRMRRDSVPDLESFGKDKTTLSMRRFQRNGSSWKPPFGVVTGYGLGLWRVKGWRQNTGKAAYFDGWLAMGSSETLLYFDEKGLVVGMTAAQRVLGLELASTFAEFIGKFEL